MRRLPAAPPFSSDVANFAIRHAGVQVARRGHAQIEQRRGEAAGIEWHELRVRQLRTYMRCSALRTVAHGKRLQEGVLHQPLERLAGHYFQHAAENRNARVRILGHCTEPRRVSSNSGCAPWLRGLTAGVEVVACGASRTNPLR